MDWLEKFVAESNMIEGIPETTQAHIDAHREFIDAGAVSIESLVALVSVLQPDAVLRDKFTIPGVGVGTHIAPSSGPHIPARLRDVLLIDDPWEQHIEYEALHPFTDGNGRSGRALWLRRHVRGHSLDLGAVERGFLHSWYYHTLQNVYL